MRRRLGQIAVLLGCLVLVTAGVLAFERSSSTSVARAVPAVSRGVVPPDPVHQRPAPKTRSTPVHGSVRAGSRLMLGRLGIDAPITPVTVTGQVMDVPLDPATLGWWSGGAAPGDPTGTTVIDGHVNYAGVSGALSVLPDVRPGDTVSIGHRRFTIQAVRTYPKSAGLPANLFTRTGPARLVLITCGGPFDAASGNYEDNIVAYAVPA